MQAECAFVDALVERQNDVIDEVERRLEAKCDSIEALLNQQKEANSEVESRFEAKCALVDKLMQQQDRVNTEMDYRLEERNDATARQNKQLVRRIVDLEEDNGNLRHRLNQTTDHLGRLDRKSNAHQHQLQALECLANKKQSRLLVK